MQSFPNMNDFRVRMFSRSLVSGHNGIDHANVGDKIEAVIGEAEPITLPLLKQISFSEAFWMKVKKQPTSEELTVGHSPSISAINCLGSFLSLIHI